MLIPHLNADRDGRCLSDMAVTLAALGLLRASAGPGGTVQRRELLHIHRDHIVLRPLLTLALRFPLLRLQRGQRWRWEW